MTAITLTASQLRDLLAPVMPHASKDDTVGILVAVRIRTAGKYVTAIATDRYRIAFQRVALDPAPEPGFDALVAVRVLKRILTIFKPGRMHDPALTLTVTDTRLTVTAADTIEQAQGLDDGGLIGASMTFQLVDGDYPKIDRLVRDALNGKPEDTAMAPSFNPAFLADFRIGQPRNTPMRIEPTGPVNKPWLIHIGEDFIGLLVPIRYSIASSAPDQDDARWLELLDEPQAEETQAA